MTLTVRGLSPSREWDDDALRELMEPVRVSAAATADAVGLPGVALGLVSAQGARSYASHGITNVDHPLPVRSTTIFQAGSISKLFTALAAMRMVETGQLDLDSPVRTWLPDLRLADPDAAARVTVRDLLQHTGGWRGDYDADTGRGEGSLRRMLEVIGSSPQLTPVGSTFHYSNLGFVLLGHLTATVHGASYETVIKELVIEPLGLTRTGFFLEDLAFERLAAGHAFRDDVAFVCDWARPRSRGPNGGVLTCVEDLLTFADFHCGDGTTRAGTRLLATDTMRQMLNPAIAFRGTGDAICLGWMFNQWAGTSVLGHSGGTLGFGSRLTILPEAGLGIVVLTNSIRGAKVIQAAQSALRAAVIGDAPAVPAPVTHRDAMEASFEGGLTLQFDDEKLTLRVGKPPEQVVCDVGEVAPDCLEVTSGPIEGLKIELLRDAQGEIEWLRLGLRLRARL